MNPEKRKRIIDKHRDAWNRHGYSANALYWSNWKIQQLRFQILCDIGIETGSSILDVGCGFGDLFAHLQSQNLQCQYLGIDLSNELLEKGRELYPQATFFNGDLFDLAPQQTSYDYVLLSGALNEEMNDDGRYAKSVIDLMYRTCKKGVALNLLDRRNSFVAGRWDLQTFLPDETIDFCRQLGAECELRDDYLDNDFTLFLRKKNVAA